MSTPKEIQKELKRMREICESAITISDVSHSSRKEQKAIEHKNQKNNKNLKEILDLTKEKELTVAVKSQNWISYQSKVKKSSFYFIFYHKTVKIP